MDRHFYGCFRVGQGHVSLVARVFAALLIGVAALATACSGGGGGGGGGGRTTETALRIIHGSVDYAPVEVRIGEVLIQRAAYADVTDYVAVEPGNTVITVTKANAPADIVGQLNVDFREDTEYSLLLLGESRQGTFGMTIVEEPIARPASGVGRVQLINALPDSPAVAVHGASYVIGPIGFSASSGFVDVPSGVQQVTVGYDNGRIVGTIDLALADRGEATIVVSGSANLNVSFIRVYYDLD